MSKEIQFSKAFSKALDCLNNEQIRMFEEVADLVQEDPEAPRDDDPDDQIAAGYELAIKANGRMVLAGRSGCVTFYVIGTEDEAIEKVRTCREDNPEE